MKPRLRTDLRIARTTPGTFLVLDPRTGESATFGGPERHLLHLLDGEHDLAEVRAAYRKRHDAPLTQRSLEEFIEQLRALGWLAGEEKQRRTLVERRAAVTLNRVFDALVLCFGWLLHPFWAVAVVAVAALAAVGLLKNHERFWSELGHVVGALPLHLIVLKFVIAFLTITFYRSLVLGITCRKFGGTLLEFRIHFLRSLIPYVHCDPGEWVISLGARGRTTMVFARLSAKVAGWALLVLGWIAATDGSALRAVLLLYSFHFSIGLVFQAIPFLKTDTYGILCWWLRVPSLWERATSEVKAWLAWRRSREALTRRERFWFRLYGLGALGTELAVYALVIAGGSWLLVTRFERAGALTAVFIVTWWFLEPLVRRRRAANQSAGRT